MALTLNLFSAGAVTANAGSSTEAINSDTKSVLDIQHWETSQGVPVYFVQTPELPMLDVDVIFHAGSSRDGDKSGIAQLTASMLDEGAGEYTADQIAEQFDDVGSIYSVDVNQDLASIGFRSLTDPKYLIPTVDAIVNVLSNPTFPDDQLDRLKKQILAALDQMRQSPSALGKQAFIKAVYGDQPYGHLVQGTPETVARLTRKDIEQFYKEYYVTENAQIVMVGDLTLDAAKEMAETLVASLSEGQVAPEIAEMKPGPSVREKIDFPSKQTTIFMGQLGIKPNTPDYFPLLVGNHILGGSGLVSKLFLEVREERGLVYGVGSYFSPLAARGSFLVYLQTRNEEASNAIEVTQNILKDYVEKGPDQKELEAAKQNIIGGFPLRISSNTDILGQLIYISYYNLPLNFLDTFRENVEKVTAEQIRDAFQKYIDPDDVNIVTVGEISALKPTHVAKKTN